MKLFFILLETPSKLLTGTEVNKNSLQAKDLQTITVIFFPLRTEDSSVLLYDQLLYPISSP